MASSRNKRSQRVDVVPLEGVDVGGEEFTVGSGGLARCRISVDRSERGAGPAERAVDRVGARIQEHRDLRGAPPQHVAQDEHRSLAGSQVL